MLGIPDPYTAAAKFAAIGLLALGLFAGGAKLGYNYSEGQNARTELLINKVADKAQESAAKVIAGLQPKFTTIQQKTETITREVPVFRDCHNTPDVFRLLNDALNGGDTTELPDDITVPKADAAH